MATPLKRDRRSRKRYRIIRCETESGRNLSVVLVERCWLCLEQPAITTVQAPDGRSFPACDVCAVEYPKGPADIDISDKELRRLTGT